MPRPLTQKQILHHTTLAFQRFKDLEKAHDEPLVFQKNEAGNG